MRLSGLQRGGEARVAQIDTAPSDSEPEPALFYALIAASEHTVGELIDFADGVPSRWVLMTAISLGGALYKDYRRGKVGAATKRRLIIFGRLIERLIFQIEKTPKRRSHLL